MVFKRLLKKDTVTRTKALQELGQLVRTGTTDSVAQVRRVSRSLSLAVCIVTGGLHHHHISCVNDLLCAAIIHEDGL